VTQLSKKCFLSYGKQIYDGILTLVSSDKSGSERKPKSRDPNALALAVSQLEDNLQQAA